MKRESKKKTQEKRGKLKSQKYLKEQKILENLPVTYTLLSLICIVTDCIVLHYYYWLLAK